MKRLAFLTLFVLLAVIITACGNVATSAPVPTTAPAATAQPTEAPQAVAPTEAAQTAAPTEAPKVVVQQPTKFEALSSGLDNAKQARIRTTNDLMGAPKVDVYVNGVPAFNAGKPQQNIDVGNFSGWLYVTPGTYTVALVPHGGTLDQALFTPVAVNAEAGHRYTMAAIGQLKEKNVKPLVVDETALEASIGAKATDNIGVSINNLQGVDGIDHLLNGKLAASMKYGEAKASICSSNSLQNEAFTVAGKPHPSFASADFWCVPASSSAASWYGDYPGNTIGSDDSQGTSELSMLDFLAAFNSHHVLLDQHLLTFNTVLAAIDKAGMHDQFAKADPYFFLAPTDEAFAALPKDQLDALLNDPQALTALLKTHFVDGYRPYGNLSGSSARPEVTNLLGQTLALVDGDSGFTINGLPETQYNYTVGNGNRVMFLDKLLPTPFEGLSSGLDNAKQARIRAVSAVMGAPNVDVYINGLPVVNGGKAQQDIGDHEFSGWVYVTPGTYTVALVPHGGTLDQALFAPVAVNAKAGHRYTVGVIGQLKENNVKPLVIDETALIATIGTKATDGLVISTNNLQGADGIDALLNGKPGLTNVNYGETQAWFCNIYEIFHITNNVIATGKPKALLGEGDTNCDPGVANSEFFYGNYPGVNSSNNSQGTSELNVLDFLAGFTSHKVVTDNGRLLTFNTLLAAIDKAGMHDQFANSGPYFFLAPTDETFAALPKAQRDALLNDPQALTTLLKGLLVEGFYPYGSFSGATYGIADREVTNMLGQTLKFTNDGVNGLQVLGPNYSVGNGNRVQFIYKLLPTTFEGLSSGLDNAKQARIRAVSAVMGAPGVDVYINGLSVVNGGKSRQNMGDGQFGGWIYVTPGTYTVALVPHDGTIDQALFAPVAVKAEAGGRYTVVAMGQLKDNNVRAQVIDETALGAGIGAKATDHVAILVNNVKGLAGFNDKLDGKPGVTDVKYGGVMAEICNVDTRHVVLTATGGPEGGLGEGDLWCAPAMSENVPWYGDYPGNDNNSNSQGTSELNTLDFLAEFNGHHVIGDDGHLLAFNTLLAAIDKAGMRDQFVERDPYFFFAPTDEAFAALPADQRDALLNDPQALAQQLKAHLVDGYYPYGSFSGATYGQADREVTNLLGQKLRFLGDGLNGQNVLGANFTVGNGNRLQMIYTLLPVK